MIFQDLLSIIAPLTVLSLFAGVLVTALSSMVSRGISERFVTRVAKLAFSTSCFATACSMGLLLAGGVHATRVLDFTILLTHGHDFHFVLKFDALAAPFVFVATILCGTVGAFSRSYLHRDPGHHRFFFLTLLFALGMEVIFMAASIEVLFIGWEVIGLSSALLISFFFERPATADNALKAFWAYRISDAALLLASLLLSSAGVSGALMTGSDHIALPATLVGALVPALIILAALPKSAQVPFSAWLPRAMEGPTPSSAIFYGGLSVHAGFYLILRLQHEYAMPTWFYIAIGVIGALTATYGYILSRVQSDIKGLLAYSAMMHVGLMFFEVGVGLYHLAVVHFVGHAFLRTYQILNAGALIHESRNLMTGRAMVHVKETLLQRLRARVYMTALDLSLRSGSEPSSFVSRLERISRWLGSFETRLVRLISAGVVAVLGLRLGARHSQPNAAVEQSVEVR